MTLECRMEFDLHEKEKELYKEFHALLADKSVATEKAISILDRVLVINENDYNAWWMRRRCPNIGTLDELEFTLKYLKESPKNYQAWYHRRWIIENFPRDHPNVADAYVMDFEDLNMHFEGDSKNHNAWQYRQWLILFSQHSLEKEFEWVEGMILLDCRNNSAWNYRHWLAMMGDPSHAAAIARRELLFVCRWLLRVPSNESVHNYLWSWLEETQEGSSPWKLKIQTEAPTAVKEMFDRLAQDTQLRSCRYVQETLARRFAATGDREQARKVYEDLASNNGVINEGYYRWLLGALGPK